MRPIVDTSFPAAIWYTYHLRKNHNGRRLGREGKEYSEEGLLPDLFHPGRGLRLDRGIPYAPSLPLPVNTPGRGTSHNGVI